MYLAYPAKDLENRFKKNLEALKEFLPKLAEEFSNYEANSELIIDTKGNINIFDKSKNAYLYPPNSNAQYETYKQLAFWMEKPSYLTIGAEYLVGGNDRDLHTRYINKLVDLRKFILKTQKIELGGKITTLIVFGIGAGFHLDFLIKNFEIENLLILEPNKDFFYISLHLIDWYKLLENFKQTEFTAIQFLIGDDAFDNSKIRRFFNFIGPFKVSASLKYTHYVSDEIIKINNILDLEAIKVFIVKGFFDDEIISLKHTLQNIKNKVSLFDPINKDLNTPEATVVVGSGPSLEFLIPYLKKYRDKLFVISCGTALGILEKNGIVADLHVNIERNKPPAEAIEKTTTPLYREKIDFLGANNNWPDIFKLFRKSAFYLKANDAGSLLFKDKTPLEFVNPTVTNTGLAMAYYLGFKKVFLFGVDLAFPEEKHHAKGSYYDLMDKNSLGRMYKGQMEVEGNFGGKVYTSSIFALSIENMEKAIKTFKEKRKEFEVYNPNRGAKIEGANPVSLEKLEELLENLPREDLSKFKNSYWNKCIEPLDLQKFEFPKVKMQLMTNFFQLKNVIIEDLEQAENLEDYKKVCENIYGYLTVMYNQNPIIFSLLQGTLTLFLGHMYVGIFVDEPVEVRLSFLEEAKKLLIEMLKEMEQEILNLYSYFPA